MMRPTTRPALALLVCCALLACAEPAGYVAARNGGPGYSALEIEPGRWRVAYRGDPETDRETVEIYLLRRAAEITLATGGDHFVMTLRDVDRRERRRGAYMIAGPWGGWSSASGAWGGVSIAVPSPIIYYDASAEILVRPGAAPPGDPSAYDARAVLATLRAESL